MESKVLKRGGMLEFAMVTVASFVGALLCLKFVVWMDHSLTVKWAVSTWAIAFAVHNIWLSTLPFTGQLINAGYAIGFACAILVVFHLPALLFLSALAIFYITLFATEPFHIRRLKKVGYTEETVGPDTQNQD
jgi:hypothetical protein